MQLNNSVDVIEKEFCNICQEFPLNASAMFTYSMVGSEVCLNLNLRHIYFVRFSLLCLYNLNKITVCLQNKITSAGNDIKNSLENLFLINVLIIRLQEN